MPDESMIERAQRVSKNWNGEDASHEGMLREFALHGHAKRATILDQFDEQLREADTSDLNKLADLLELRRSMDDAHHKMRRVNR